MEGKRTTCAGLLSLFLLLPSFHTALSLGLQVALEQAGQTSSHGMAEAWEVQGAAPTQRPPPWVAGERFLTLLLFFVCLIECN